MASLKDQIYRLISERRNVSYIEIQAIEGTKGTLEHGFFDKNLLLWHGLSAEAIDAIEDLIEERKIYTMMTTPLVYFIDGQAINLPVAKDIKAYKKLHWLPITFNPTR